MLQIIAGRSGSGKTEEVWRRLETAARAENTRDRCVLLVPEQFSFETERALLSRLGPELALRIKVYSFTRMAEMVRREVGGRSGLPMAAGTRVVLLAKAIRETADQLNVYQTKRTDAARLGSMLALLEELHGCAVTAEDLAALSEKLEDGALKHKIHDLALIDEGYQALVAQSYLDPMDDLAHLAEDLPRSRAFQGAVVFVDGFKSFTGQEMRVLDELMGIADQVTVTLGYDPIAPQADDLDLFSEAVKTAERLESMARRRSVPVKAVCRLTENYRHRANPALATLEERLFRVGSEAEDIPADFVEVTVADSIYEECRLAVRRLHRYLREGGRCRRATIVTRDLATYRGILEPMLDRAGIPHYMDSRETVRTDPLIVTVIEALQCVTGNWQTEPLLKLMKTGLLGFSAHSIALMENYLYMWNLRGASWKREWTDNPDGLSASVTDKTRQKLWYLNLLRRRLVTPLIRLQKRLAGGCSGEQFAEAIYDYLQETRVRRSVVLRVRRLKRNGDRDLADRAARVWDVLMGLLDQFAAAAGTETQQPDEFLSMFTLAADLTDIGSIPAGVDMVQIGQADRIRYSEPDLVLVLGANVGVFPATPQKGGLLGDAERVRLTECGLPLTDTSAHRMMEERYFAYAAVSAPTKQLTVSYRTVDGNGQSLDPSLLVTEIRRLLPQIIVKADDPAEAETPEELFHYLTGAWKRGDTLAASLHTACASFTETAERYDRMQKASQDRNLRFDSPKEAKRLFSRLSNVSPSSVDTFYKCPFRYFCNYGLRLKERQRAELNSLEFGTAAHYVMENCIPTYVEKGFSTLRKADVMQDAAAMLQRYVEEVMGGKEGKPDRFLYLLARLERLCGYFLWHMVRELRQSRFVPTDFELRIGDAADDKPSIPPIEVKLPDGASIRVIGTIDRVDVYKVGETAYVRVVDYKTGHKKLRLDDVVNGINLQLLVYLSSLWENGAERYGGTVVPAGMLYLPSKLPIIGAADAGNPEIAQARTMTMNGLILDNPEIIGAMEEEVQGLFIPIRQNKNGSVTANSVSSLATLAQFGQLKRRAEKLLGEMMTALREGQVAPNPIFTTTVQACNYCPYHTVCGREPGDTERRIPATSNQEILAELQQSEREEESDVHGEAGGSADPD